MVGQLSWGVEEKPILQSKAFTVFQLPLGQKSDICKFCNFQVVTSEVPSGSCDMKKSDPLAHVRRFAKYVDRIGCSVSKSIMNMVT